MREVLELSDVQARADADLRHVEIGRYGWVEGGGSAMFERSPTLTTCTRTLRPEVMP